MYLGEAHNLLERLGLGLQIAALQTDESVWQGVVLVLMRDVLLNNLHEVGQGHHGTAHHEVVLCLLLLARQLLSHNVLQSDGLCHLVHHADLLARAVDHLKLALRKHYCQGNAGEASARAKVENARAVAELNLVGYGKRVQHMVLIEVVHVLTRDHVNLAVPVLVQLLELGKLRALRVGQIGEIFQYQFHIFIYNIVYNKVQS